MGRMARIYQVSLRTIFELIFVAAVVLAFLYWRNMPPADPAGRYQVIRTGELLLFIDTKTGKVWHGWIGNDDWTEIPTPVDKSK